MLFAELNSISIYPKVCGDSLSMSKFAVNNFFPTKGWSVGSPVTTWEGKLSQFASP